MTKHTFIYVGILAFITLACGSTTPLATPEPASVEQTSPTPEQIISPAETPEAEPENGTGTDISVPGLRVFYVREGNLWSWTEAGGASQLTDAGDISTVSVSEDGQYLAFMRGREVWTVRLDGTDARLLTTQEAAGGKLWFAPDNVLLAVSTRDHIDVIDLNAGSKITVVTYPAIPGGYFPEVVWMPDSAGFKTVIPSLTEGGEAEMLYVFPDGTVASLAKFKMVVPADSPPYFSPDGGYVIYVAALEDGKRSLFLMDSSGATRPYGESAGSVRAYGWLQDSKRFLYRVGDPPDTFIGSVDGPPAYNETAFPETVRWVDNEYYLALQNGDLILGNLYAATMLIDSNVMDFDVIRSK